jgi:hypothetical protein
VVELLAHLVQDGRRIDWPLAVVDLDLLLADLLGHLALLGDRLGVHTDPLAGHRPLLDHRGLLMQGDLVLRRGDGMSDHRTGDDSDGSGPGMTGPGARLTR